MENLNLGLRSQDFHEGLRETKAFGPKEAYFGNTLLIGKAATLAMHLRGLLYVDDYTVLKYAAGQLGIGVLELPAVLGELQEVDFVRVIRDGESIKRVDIRVPEFRTGYEELGERWNNLRPSEIEQAGVATLQNLFNTPTKEEALIKQLGLSPKDYAIMKDVMESGQLVAVQTVSGERVVYSPLAIDGNPAKYLQWVRRFPSDVSSAIKTLTQYQGLPISDPAISGNASLLDAIQTGVLVPVQVCGATGEQRFIFTPRGGLTPEERVVLDKARAIVACVRYGQKFSAGRAIFNPKRILETLRENKRFRRGHPDLYTQYGALVEKFIGHPVKETNDRWNFEIYDTPENIKALDIAISLVEIGETPTAKMDLEVRKAMVTTGDYLSPISTRVRLATSIRGSPETQAEIIKQLGAIGRGMKI